MCTGHSIVDIKLYYHRAWCVQVTENWKRIMMMMIIALKDNLRFSISSLRCKTASNTYAQVAQVQSCAVRQVLITCSRQCATLYKGTAQLLGLTELKSHLLFSFILLAETINPLSPTPAAGSQPVKSHAKGNNTVFFNGYAT